MLVLLKYFADDAILYTEIETIDDIDKSPLSLKKLIEYMAAINN